MQVLKHCLSSDRSFAGSCWRTYLFLFPAAHIGERTRVSVMCHTNQKQPTFNKLKVTLIIIKSQDESEC